MMNLTQKIFTIIGTVMVLTYTATTKVHAQETEDKIIKAQTITEFADGKGGSFEAYVKRLELDKNTDEEGKSKIIPCGSFECDRETQKCIKCTETSYTSDPHGPGTSSGGNTYKCIGKNEKASDYNTEYSNWFSPYSSSTTCTEVDFGIGDSSYVGFVTIKDGSNCNLQDSSGNKYCLLMKDDEIVVEYADANKSMKGCEVLPVKLYNMRKCFFCPLFSVVFAAAEKMPSISFNKLAAAFATLIALGLAIWIAIQTLTHVSSLTKQDAPKFLAGLIKQSYKFLIAFLLLQYGNQIFTHAVNPVLSAGINFGTVFLENNHASEQVQTKINQEIIKRNSSVKGYGYYLPKGSENTRIEDMNSNINQQNLYIELDRYVSDIQREIAFMQAVGSSLVCTGNRTLLHKTEVETFADGFKMILQGMVFAIFGFLLSLAFAFYMIDAVVQLGIVGALMPFLIASWPFKVTSQYAGTGFKMLLNSAFIFVFIGLTVEVNMQLINAALTNNVGSKQEIKASNTDDVSMGALQEIAIAINEQDSTKLTELTDISTMGFLILIFCCIFGFKFMGQTSSLAGQFSSGGIKPSIATMGASAALSGAKKVSKPVREAIGRKAEDAEMAVVGAIAHPIKTAKSIGRGVRNIFRGKKGGGSSGEGGSESETETESKKKGSSTTTESSTKKKSPVVGQKGEKTDKTENSQPGNGPKVGQKSDTNGNVEAENKGDASENREENKVDNNAESSTTSAENGTSENASSENSGDSVQPQKPHAQKQTTSQNQRRYKGKKDRGRMQKNKQRRNYGKRHK